MEKEIELFSSIDEYIIEQVCAVLEKNNIKNILSIQKMNITIPSMLLDLKKR